jgi:hypothetical protein
MKIEADNENKRIALEDIESDQLFFALLEEIRVTYESWKNWGDNEDVV